MAKLSPAQQRILDEVRRDGERKYNGRARKPIKALEIARLVEVDWNRVAQAKGGGIELVEVITVRPRVPDRHTHKELKLHRRPKIEPGSQLTIEGIRGRCDFVGYTKHTSGSEWIDVITSRGFSRTVDPAKIKTVHRKKSY